MATRNLLFQVHHGGIIDRRQNGEYVGGKTDVYHEPYDEDQLSWIEIQTIMAKYGYHPGDLVYYRHPSLGMHNGLKLLTSDHDVLSMVAALQDQQVAHLYLVSHSQTSVHQSSLHDHHVEEDVSEDEEEAEARRLGLNDPFWKEVLSSEDELYDIDVDTVGTSRSKPAQPRSKGVESQVTVDDKEPQSSSDAEDEEDERRNQDRSGPRWPEEDDIAVDLEKPKISVGMKFGSTAQFRETIRRLNLNIGKSIKFAKNDGDRVTVVCNTPKCPYRVYGSWIRGQQTFQIKSMNPRHDCSRSYKNLIVTSSWIADKMMPLFISQPNVPIKALVDEIKRKWGVEVPKMKLYRARAKAQFTIFGSHIEQYAKVWDYCETLKQRNQGSCLLVRVERIAPELPPIFQKMYVGLAACRKSFKAGCRPLIGLDGCFLKGPFKGQLLCAVGRDANDNMYPIAMAIVEAELKDSWGWFIETLISDLGQQPEGGWTFISDRQKGLKPAMEELVPYNDSRICVRHLYANFRDAGHRGVALKEKLWQAATAYTKRDFERAMEELKALSQPAYDYLKVIDPSQWSRAWFNTFSKSDLVVNNLSECFNAYILQARDKPIVTMVETIRKKLMGRYQLKREAISKWENTITPRIVAKLELMHDLSIYCTPTYAGCGQFEVNNAGRQYVVDLKKRTCSCLRWDITGNNPGGQRNIEEEMRTIDKEQTS
ncbi:uncharacterized protein LOC118348629 [Juglans regia]|uniref:Uncharacterized protein LOC118348629 n=1 Tax=Juglans regia TaxID=51240 RepID=A0A6P9EEA3_JUGRE|nr:uncharacterized protein LOC118348629 [Juglans regia]